MPFESPVTGAAFCGEPGVCVVMTSGVGQITQLVRATISASSRVGFVCAPLGGNFHGDVECASLCVCPLPQAPLVSMTRRSDVCLIDSAGRVLDRLAPNGIENNQVRGRRAAVPVAVLGTAAHRHHFPEYYRFSRSRACTRPVRCLCRSQSLPTARLSALRALAAM